MRVRHGQGDRLSVSGAGRGRVISRGHWQLPAVGAGVLAVTLAGSALDPTPARAWVLGLPSPGSVVSGLLGGLGHVIGGTVGKVAVTAFDAIIHALFAPIAKFINTQLLGWLVAVPDYARAGSHVAGTEQTVLAMAGAALGRPEPCDRDRRDRTDLGCAGAGVRPGRGLFHVSIYEQLRAQGPDPDLSALSEAVDFCAFIRAEAARAGARPRPLTRASERTGALASAIRRAARGGHASSSARRSSRRRLATSPARRAPARRWARAGSRAAPSGPRRSWRAWTAWSKQSRVRGRPSRPPRWRSSPDRLRALRAPCGAGRPRPGAGRGTAGSVHVSGRSRWFTSSGIGASDRTCRCAP